MSDVSFWLAQYVTVSPGEALETVGRWDVPFRPLVLLAWPVLPADRVTAREVLSDLHLLSLKVGRAEQLLAGPIALLEVHEQSGLLIPIVEAGVSLTLCIRNDGNRVHGLARIGFDVRMVGERR